MQLIEVGDRMINADQIAYVARGVALHEMSEGLTRYDVVKVFFTGGTEPLELPWENGGQALLTVLRKLGHERERQERGRVTRGRIGPDD